MWIPSDAVNIIFNIQNHIFKLLYQSFCVLYMCFFFHRRDHRCEVPVCSDWSTATERQLL